MSERQDGRAISEREQRAWEAYQRDAHAMQSAQAAELSANPKPATPKHLRVGVNCAMSDHGALVQLLIAKGVFTSEEYAEAAAKAMRDEARRAALRAREALGLPDTVTFG